MIDPIGRFFSNVGGRYVYSRPILEVGVNAAFADVQFEYQKFLDRDGHYEWVAPTPLTVSIRR